MLPNRLSIIAIALLFCLPDPMVAQKSPQGLHEVKIDTIVAQRLSTWDWAPDWYSLPDETPLNIFLGNKYVFYTSKSEPLKTLSDLDLEGGPRLGSFPMTTDLEMFAMVLLWSVGVDTDNRYGIGGGHWPKLFVDSPDLRLFIVPKSSESRADSTIATTGGGVKAKFVLSAERAD